MTAGHEVEPLQGVVTAGPRPARGSAIRMERIALVDLLDRVLAGGVVVTGEVTLSIADVDLVTVSLRALITSVSALAGPDSAGALTDAGPRDPGS
jgi:hypothetical protein